MSTFENRITGSGEEDPAQLLANPENWRVHPKEQRDILGGILSEVGWVQNVIVNETTGHLIDGHLRVKVAMENDEPTIPVVYVQLTPEEEKMILATIDPIAGLAGTDQAMLDRLLEGIEAENDDLAAFLSSLASDDQDEETEGLCDDDEAPEPGGEPITQPGDVWVLGDHRLMCGDSTDVEAVEKLMEKRIADMVWTDPPYNVDYEGSDGQKIQNDNMEDSAFKQFLIDAFATALVFTKEGGPIYVAHADSEGLNFRAAMRESGWLLKQCIIWAKNSFTLGRQDYQWQHEPVLYGWKPGAAHAWYGEFNKSTVIDDDIDVSKLSKPDLMKMVNALRNAQNTTVVREPKPSRNDDHPTMKPVALVLGMIRNSSKKGDRVLDLFGGSGTTLIAAEKIGRAANIMEMDPRYCDVIARRYEKYTGRMAFLSDGRSLSELEISRDY